MRPANTGRFFAQICLVFLYLNIFKSPKQSH